MASFAKQTGDLYSLSITDIGVLALAWMMEKQYNGVDHLNAHPSIVSFSNDSFSAICQYFVESLLWIVVVLDACLLRAAGKAVEDESSSGLDS